MDDIIYLPKKNGVIIMGYRNIFRRVETKFIITEKQKEELMLLFSEYMTEDSYGKSTICNIYYDTPSFLLVRRSLEKPIYKEKLRLRSYGIADNNSDVFIEIKKKYRSVVYKRRISAKESDAVKYLESDKKCSDTQVGKEIDYMFELYEGLSPRVFLSYRREAFYGKDDPEFRVTFDTDILWRDHDLSLKAGVYGSRILEEGKVLLEVKSSGGIPLWLTSYLSESKIYKTSFSKYGNAYLSILSRNKRMRTNNNDIKGDTLYASGNF